MIKFIGDHIGQSCCAPWATSECMQKTGTTAGLCPTLSTICVELITIYVCTRLGHAPYLKHAFMSRIWAIQHVHNTVGVGTSIPVDCAAMSSKRLQYALPREYLSHSAATQQLIPVCYDCFP